MRTTLAHVSLRRVAPTPNRGEEQGIAGPSAHPRGQRWNSPGPLASRRTGDGARPAPEPPTATTPRRGTRPGGRPRGLVLARPPRARRQAPPDHRGGCPDAACCQDAPMDRENTDGPVIRHADASVWSGVAGVDSLAASGDDARRASIRRWCEQGSVLLAEDALAHRRKRPPRRFRQDPAAAARRLPGGGRWRRRRRPARSRHVPQLPPEPAGGTCLPGERPVEQQLCHGARSPLAWPTPIPVQYLGIWY